MVLTFKSVIKHLCVTIQIKATKQYFHVVLFIMLYKMVLTFKSVDETLVCRHSNESRSKLLRSTNDMVLFITLYKVVLSWTFVKETLV